MEICTPDFVQTCDMCSIKRHFSQKKPFQTRLAKKSGVFCVGLFSCRRFSFCFCIFFPLVCVLTRITVLMQTLSFHRCAFGQSDFLGTFSFLSAQLCDVNVCSCASFTYFVADFWWTLACFSFRISARLREVFWWTVAFFILFRANVRFPQKCGFSICIFPCFAR